MEGGEKEELGLRGTSPNFCQPRVTTDLGDGDPPRNVDFKARTKKVLDFVGETNFGPRDATLLGGFGIDEGALAGDEDGEEDAEGPDLGRGSLVRLAAKDLGRGEGGGAVEAGVERCRLTRVVDDGGAKVDELDAK